MSGGTQRKASYVHQSCKNEFTNRRPERWPSKWPIKGGYKTISDYNRMDDVDMAEKRKPEERKWISTAAQNNAIKTNNDKAKMIIGWEVNIGYVVTERKCLIT